MKVQLWKKRVKLEKKIQNDHISWSHTHWTRNFFWIEVDLGHALEKSRCQRWNQQGDPSLVGLSHISMTTCFRHPSRDGWNRHIKFQSTLGLYRCAESSIPVLAWISLSPSYTNEQGRYLSNLSAKCHNPSRLRFYLDGPSELPPPPPGRTLPSSYLSGWDAQFARGPN